MSPRALFFKAGAPAPVNIKLVNGELHIIELMAAVGPLKRIPFEYKEGLELYIDASGRQLNRLFYNTMYGNILLVKRTRTGKLTSLPKELTPNLWIATLHRLSQSLSP